MNKPTVTLLATALQSLPKKANQWEQAQPDADCNKCQCRLSLIHTGHTMSSWPIQKFHDASKKICYRIIA